MRSQAGVRYGAVCLAAAALLAAAPAVPEPVLVDGPLDLPAELGIAPAIQRVEVGDDGAVVTHTIDQGLPGELSLALEATTAIATEGGPAAGPDAGPLRLPADRVVLGQGERATVTSAAPAGSAGEVVAVSVTADSERMVTALVVLAAPDARDELRLATEVDGTRIRASVTSVGAAAVADVRLRVTPPSGPDLISREIGPLVLLADEPRDVAWDVTLPPLPFPVTYHVEAIPAAGAATQDAAVVWSPGGRIVLAGAGVLVVIGVAVITVRMARRRRATLS